MINRSDLIEPIRPFYHTDLIKIITGIRRCGKSVVLQQIVEEIRAAGVSEEKILYINFEDYDYSHLIDGKALHEYVKAYISNEGMYYLFFDEIQMVAEFELVINSLRVKYGASIFITGSNGKLLSEELATYLSGRTVSFRIYPFSFAEACQMQGIERDSITDETFIDYMTWGGMPQRFALQDEEQVKIYLRDLYDTIVLRDVVTRAGIKEIDSFNRLSEYIMNTPAQIFSVESIEKYFQSVNRKISKDALYNYLEHMTSSLIINRASRYDIRGKRILTKMDKLYLTDLGLGRVRNTGFKLEMGALLENVVYIELMRRGNQVYVGKTRTGEIDFVVMNGNERVYYQVAYYLYDQSVIDREFGAYKNIMDNSPKYVLSMDKMDFSRDGIIHKNVVDFLLENTRHSC